MYRSVSQTVYDCVCKCVSVDCSGKLFEWRKSLDKHYCDASPFTVYQCKLTLCVCEKGELCRLSNNEKYRENCSHHNLEVICKTFSSQCFLYPVNLQAEL